MLPDARRLSREDSRPPAASRRPSQEGSSHLQEGPADGQDNAEPPKQARRLRLRSVFPDSPPQAAEFPAHGVQGKVELRLQLLLDHLGKTLEVALECDNPFL